MFDSSETKSGALLPHSDSLLPDSGALLARSGSSILTEGGAAPAHSANVISGGGAILAHPGTIQGASRTSENRNTRRGDQSVRYPVCLGTFVTLQSLSLLSSVRQNATLIHTWVCRFSMHAVSGVLELTKSERLSFAPDLSIKLHSLKKAPISFPSTIHLHQNFLII
jgi:hypothetical protein